LVLVTITKVTRSGEYGTELELYWMCHKELREVTNNAHIKDTAKLQPKKSKVLVGDIRN